MKLIVDYAALKSALSLCGLTKGAEKIIPICGNVLLVAKDDSITVSSTDIELTVVTHIEALVTEPGSLTVSLSSLSDIVKSADDSLKMESAENGRLNIASGSAKWALPTMPAEDFPTTPVIDDAEELTLGAYEILPMLRVASYAMSADEKRFNVNGCYLAINKKSVDVVSTDGYRMALCELPRKSHKEATVMLPANLVGASDKLSASGADVAVTWNNNHVQMSQGDVMLIARREEGNFIRYREVLPVESFSLSLDLDKMKSALRRAVPFTIASKCVRFDLSNDNLALSTENTERGRFADAVTVDYSGDDKAMRFSGAYLLDALSTIYTSRMEFAFSDSGPGGMPTAVLRPIESDLPFTTQHVVMSMVLK